MYNRSQYLVIYQSQVMYQFPQPTLACPLSALEVTAHRLATTEQSDVISCTRSILPNDAIAGLFGSFLPSRTRFILPRASSGLFQPEKNCIWPEESERVRLS